MKKNFILLLLATTICFGFRWINDVLSDVGTTIEEVKQLTIKQIAKKDFDLPYYTKQIRESCKKLPAGVREATMLSLGKIVRDYVESPEFEKAYFAYVENQMGGGRMASGNSKTDEQWQAERQKKVDNLVKAMKASPSSLEIYAQTVDVYLESAKSKVDLLKESPGLPIGVTKEEADKELADWTAIKELYGKDKEAFMKKYAEVTVDAQLKMDKQQQQQNLAEQEKAIAELKDYKSILRKQLRYFLSETAAVDFNARLVQKDDKMVFADPKYESKSQLWKFSYRCGKEATAGARKFAQSWLAALK